MEQESKREIWEQDSSRNVHIISLKCPECNASLEIEKNRDIIYCTYCGCKLKIYNDNEHFIRTEKIYRNIDDAQIYRAETERIMKIKYSEERKKLSSGAILGIILLGIGFITVICSLLLSDLFGGDFTALVVLMGLAVFITGIAILIKTRIIDRDY